MPLIYVTGLPGTGKSAVLHELQVRGFEAHGTDEDGLADPVTIQRRPTRREDNAFGKHPPSWRRPCTGKRPARLGVRIYGYLTE